MPSRKNWMTIVEQFPDLPDDNYGVFVENDMDVKRLQYLVAAIGEQKLRKSVAKDAARGWTSYVSALLKRFWIQVPPSIYAPVHMPLYRTYVLVLPAESRLKVGYSGNWIGRAASFTADGSLHGIDLRRSVGISFMGKKLAASQAERAVLKRYESYRVPPPDFVPFGAGGRTEWLPTELYDDVVHMIRNFGADQARDYLTLEVAIQHNKLLWQMPGVDIDTGVKH